MLDNSRKKTAVYGIGKQFKKNIKYLDSSFFIEYFTDSDPTKWGLEPLKDGRKCIEPEKLKDYGIEYVIISIENREICASIKKRLDSLGLVSYIMKDVLRECVKKWDNIQIQKYDAINKNNNFKEESKDSKIARYVECYMLRQACNLRCSYCFVGQSRELSERVIPMLHSPALIVRALSKKRLGGVCLISICCDGEPLMSMDMIELISMILNEGHYVYLISNGTLTKQMKKLSTLPKELLSHLFIRFSYHYFELKRLNLVDTFFENIRRFHSAGGSFTLFLVGSERYISEINEIKQLSLQHLGALPHVDYERNESNCDGSVLVIQTDKEKNDYKKIWESFDSNFLKFREKTDGKITGQCNSGKWVIHLDLMSGEVSRCPVGSHLCNLYDNICEPIPFDTKSHGCPYEFCVCAPVFFAFGMKEDLKDTPSFYELWNRKTESGDNWIHDSAKEFFSGKLYDNTSK
ncbi:MAG: radical SAM protein [Dorea sp.]|nr:radical SAM protein [Dorea sp.]